jgi:hypothetical protein
MHIQQRHLILGFLAALFILFLVAAFMLGV